MRWRDRPIVAFDTETTGLEPFNGDRIIEVAAVQLFLDDQGHIVERRDFGKLINPGISIPRKVTEITGITDADVASAPRFEEVAEELQQILGSGVAVAHNFPFDLAFLTVEFRKCGLDWPEPIAEVDTVDLSIKHFPDASSHKLGDVCKRMGVSLDNAHRATDDAAACGEVFAKLAARHEVEDELQAMLDWANAIGRPPEDGPLMADDRGRLVFRDGPHQGKPIMEYPLHLSWMEKAKERGPNGWQHTYSDATRRWIRRWLNIRGSGRARQNPKSFGAADWVLDSCIAVERRRAGMERRR